MRPSCYNLHRDWTHKYTKSWKRSETHHSNCTLSQISEMDTNCTTTTTHMGKIVDEELHAILGLEGPILNHPFIQNLPVERHFSQIHQLCSSSFSCDILCYSPMALPHHRQIVPFSSHDTSRVLRSHKNTQINTNPFLKKEKKRKRRK